MNSVLKVLLSLSFAALAASMFAADPVHGELAGPTPAAALRQLIEGNRRFASGAPQHPNQNETRRKEVAVGQKPVAIVLTCADSRLSPELLFDQGLGDIFVLRNAGNILDDHTLGSIEYAVEHLHAPLILVLGHENCGAVKATLDGGSAPGHIGSIIESIKPALNAAASEPGDKLDNLVRANVLLVASQLQQSQPIIGAAVKEGKVKIAAARYTLATGKVELLK
jgi:carbonic anhydrase